MFKFKLVGRDGRGEKYSFLVANQKWVVIITKKGKLRGGHLHSKKQLHVMLAGKWLVWAKLKGKQRKFILKAGEAYISPVGEIHMVKALERSIHIEQEQNSKTFMYKPWRRLVEKDK